MDIPANPTNAGQSVNGKVSWFGGPGDSTDSGHTANGETTRTPGIAIYNRATLGGYWRVTGANGKTAVLKQTDLGPAPFTGRKIDVTYSALGKFGYNEGNFPTNSEFKATYLGHNPGASVQEAPATAIPQAPQSKVTLPGTPARQVSELDKPAFEKAQKGAVLGKLLSSEGGTADNPLFSTGLVSTKAPVASEYTTSKTIPGTPAATRETPGKPVALPGQPGRPGKLGGFLGPNAPLEMKRIDQGQDIQTRPGEAILAPGDGKVVAVKSDPTGFGPAYPVVQFKSGPLAGQSWYVGHTDAALRAGEEFKAGEAIAHTSKTGHNAPPGWAEIGLASALGTGNMQAGQQTVPYLRGKR